MTCGVVGLRFPKEAVEIEYRGQKLVLIPGARQKDDRSATSIRWSPWTCRPGCRSRTAGLQFRAKDKELPHPSLALRRDDELLEHRMMLWYCPHGSVKLSVCETKDYFGPNQALKTCNTLSECL